MATIVERPMSALSDMQPTSQLSRRDSIEIIDVDSFDHLEGSSSQPQRTRPTPRHRPLQRRPWSQPETISLIDSDDEEDFFPQILSSHNVDPNRSHRRLISPPPLRTATISSVIPPVPTLHPQYAAQTSLPMRLQPPAYPSPPVVPRNVPFNFEMSPGPPVRGTSIARRPEPRAAPVSHHLPPMGFGGALISSNREQAILRHSRSAAATSRRRNANRNNSTRQIGALDFAHLFDDELPPAIRTYLATDNYESRQRNNWGHGSRDKEEYYQSYTHPPQPEPGFTFDFAPEDEDVPRSRFFPPTSIDEPIILDDDDNERSPNPLAGSSSYSGARERSPAGRLDALLVCAKCLDPLILNAGLDPEEAQYRRVWGLRCGHLIDEKCLNELGQPQEEDQVIDRKGKGKAKAVQKHTYGDAVPELQSLAEAEPPNIRSRLRSRVANLFQTSSSSSADAEASSSSSAVPAALAELDAVVPPAKRRRVTNKKAKIQGEFEWPCPVANCGRVHVSVKIDGIWGPEKQKDFKGVKGLPAEARGAVAVFA
ncbi:hypothetical protein GALMADRAFT_266136 [Galerina marginata CBS 339.88]|uniref:Uncharacterized protein n=1 Tax=Galerina marginata (strain CBS 339.88) TaxID=685588 RepID=A0A067TI89_GALM3|nr:hypothetical protein GALMADRAFT_266136 [Galerina marginata CBS 339.88]